MINEQKGRMITFRANQYDLKTIDEMKRILGEGIRKVTDADVIREGLISLTQKKNIKNSTSNVIPRMEGEVPLPLSIPSLKVESTQVVSQETIPTLSSEQIKRGERYIDGVLCDSSGYPVDEMNGDVVVRNGEVYATEPRREALKEMAANNSAGILVDTPAGKMNPAMAAVLEETPSKISVLIKSEHPEIGGVPNNDHSPSLHSDPGMLTTQYEGVDEEVTEDFIG